jgi:prepilin-type N-terminal cleavage/methylation domain-containing protein
MMQRKLSSVKKPEAPTRIFEKGFTLIEILVVLAIMGIVLASLYGVLRTQQRSFAVQEEVSSVQRDARSALSILERDVRTAGLGVPRGNSPVSAVQNGTLLDPTAPDQVGVNRTIGPITFLTSNTVTQPGNNIAVDSVAGFSVGDTINLITLLGNTSVGQYTINGIDAGAKLLSLDGTPAGITTGDLLAKNFKTVTYSVVTNGVTNRQELHRNDGVVDSVLVDGVLDFQLVYGLEDGTTSNSPTDLSTVRRVQISLTAETHRDVSDQNGLPRTRQLVTTVPIKNVRV